MTGMFCIVLLDNEESVECWLAVFARVTLGFAGKLSYLLGEDLPGTEDVRGGSSGPSATKSLLSCLAGGVLVLECFDWPSSISPVLLMLPCLGMIPFGPSRPLRWRSRCCFFLRPCRRFIMISLILGKKLSKLACEASWLSVSSNIPRKSSGTLPRSWVSTPIALKAREAMLNSYPRRT